MTTFFVHPCTILKCSPKGEGVYPIPQGDINALWKKPINWISQWWLDKTTSESTNPSYPTITDSSRNTKPLQKYADFNLDSNLSLLTLIACKLSGQTLPCFKEEQAPSHNEARAYAAMITEKLEFIAELEFALANDLEIHPKTTWSPWKTSNTIERALLRGETLGKAIEQAVQTTLIKQLSHTKKGLLIDAISQAIEAANESRVAGKNKKTAVKLTHNASLFYRVVGVTH